MRSEEKDAEQSSRTANKVKFKNTAPATLIIKLIISNKAGKWRDRRITILTADKKIQPSLFLLHNPNEISPY
jgi:hypothetical protein